MKKKISLSSIILFCLLALFVVITPNVLTGYYIKVVNIALIFAIAAYGISILLGMGGQLSFAALSFMGGGAYFVANLTTGRLGIKVSSVTALLLAMVFFAIVSFILGLILLRLKGTYFTFATIGLVQVAYAFFNNYKPLFGGPDGIAGIPTLTLFGYKLISYNDWFYVLIGITLIVAVIVERIRRTQLGRSLASIRDNETAAKTFGVNVYMTKVIAFMIAGILGALAGALYCMHGKFVSSDMYNYANSTQFIIMAMIGGVNNTVGIFVGALLVKLLPEVLRSFQNYMQLFWGIMIIVLMIFMPTGLAGLYQQIKEAILIRRKKGSGKEKEDEANITS